MIKIEFFHDVICSFCFPMAYRMRKIKEKYNNVDIQHKSFALNWNPEDFVRGFGSREAAKEEILGHWVHANENDDLHRFNIEGMRKSPVQFPTSRPGLLAAKAAGILGGEEKYFDVFDGLQSALFEHNRDLEDIKVLEDIALQAGLDLGEWRKVYESENTEKAVFQDLALAQRYGINSAPSLVIEEKYLVQGAQPMEALEKALEDIAKKEDKNLNLIEDISQKSAGLCQVVDGKMECE